MNVRAISGRLNRSAGPVLAFVVVIGLLVLAACEPVPEPPPSQILVVLTEQDNMTWGMSMVLANQSVDQGAEVRVLLCGPGAPLAITGRDGEPLQPRDVSPGQLLERLLEHEVVVEVCAIFLPNTDWAEDDLRPGVGVAQPADVASYMLRPGVKLFTF
jgi:hypothetical protein